MDGGKQPLRTWEKVYWGVFVTGFSVFLLSRVSVWTSAEPEDPAVSKLATLTSFSGCGYVEIL